MTTDKTLMALQPKDKRYTINLGDSVFLRVNPSGYKCFVLRLAKSCKVHDFTLGTFPDINIKQAKQLAHLKREEYKAKPVQGMTLKDVFKLWKKKKKHLASFENETRRIEKWLIPVFGNVELEKIDAPSVFAFLSKLTNKLPTLKRALCRLNEMLDLAVYAGLLKNNPCHGMSRVFGQHQAINRPFIPVNRLHELFELTKDQPEWFKLYLLWSIYSLCRPKESASLRWDWIQNDIVEFPAEIMKKRRIHRVPLCPAVQRLLKRAKEIRAHKSIYVWCQGRDGGMISPQYITKWIAMGPLRGQLCHHGFRATGRTWMRDQRIDCDIAEDALAHVSGTQTERAYIRGDYLEQRRKVMQDWWDTIYAEYCKVCEPLECLSQIQVKHRGRPPKNPEITISLAMSYPYNDLSLNFAF